MALVLGLLILKLGMVGAAVFIVLPIIVAGALVFIYNPKLGIYILVFMSFAIPGLTRYFPGPPFGLTIDIFLVLTLLVVFLKDFKKIEFGRANNDLVWAWAVWMLSCILMILNPLARSLAAGGFQSIARLKSLLNVFKYGWASFEYVSHRVMRWAVAPFMLPLILLLNVVIVILDQNLLFQVLLVLQMLFYGAAILGWVLEQRKIKLKILFVPFYFSMMNYAVLAGFKRHL